MTPSQVVGEDNSIAGGLDAALLSAIGDRPIVILTPNMGGGSGDIGDSAAKLKEAQKLVDTAPDKAIDPLKGVVDTYEASMAQVEDFDPYLQALSLLATAYYNSGYEDEFSSAVKKFAVLRPEGAAPKDTNEEVADEISKAQAKVKKAAKGTVKITASDPAFQVRVDGVDKAGAKSLSLPPGVHFIVVTAPGQTPYMEKVTVSASGTSQLTANLSAVSNNGGAPSSIEKASAPNKELIDFLKKGTINAEARKQAVDLAKKNKADFVVLNIVARDSGQYRAYFYALRAKDAKVVELANPSYTPGPAATLSSKSDEVLGGLVGIAYNFPEAKAIPASPAITIVAKGAVPLVVGTPGDPVDPANPANPNPTKVNPYDVGVAKLSGGSDNTLTAPPDAMGNNNGNDGNGNEGNGKIKYSLLNPEVPKGTKPKEEPKEPKTNGRANRNALRPDPEPRPARDPITFGEVSGKWWFWPAVGVVGAGVVGTGVYFIAKPNGLDATITWP